MQRGKLFNFQKTNCKKSKVEKLNSSCTKKMYSFVRSKFDAQNFADIKAKIAAIKSAILCIL